MAVPKSVRRRDYIRYAEHCLSLVPAISARDDRAINREMAAEWLRLADATAHPLKPDAMKAALSS
jgi:hypothetical protein